ncbi:MAG: hypothetical protein M1834_006666 [Cirrosporium novae-zelandiae]|nr:MAG: hypothetical protein M1834_006666 [Cirrosporium novae-zelandiae]
MVPFLPNDILDIICEQLWHQGDFNTLFNCAVSCKRLVTPAVKSLYRMHDVAPVTYSGRDETELSRREGKWQNQTVRKWAQLWRSIVLSAFDQTFLRYCQYIRGFDLGDLASLFEDSCFRGDVDKLFFGGELSKFNIDTETLKRDRGGRFKPARRLNIPAALDAIGEVVTQKTPRLEALSGDILASALPRWVSRLPRLQRLKLWSGEALKEGAGLALHAHCPLFNTLRIYIWYGDDVDDLLAQFFNGLRPHSLKSFEIMGRCHMGSLSVLALNTQSRSLTDLTLTNIKSSGIRSLPLLKECRNLRSLSLEDTVNMNDEGHLHNDTLVEIIAWLSECRQLERLSLRYFHSAPFILIPLLLNNNIPLSELSINGYSVQGNRAFHEALGQKQTLKRVLLNGEGEDVDRDDLTVLVDSLCQLHQLRRLQLLHVSTWFQNEHISTLANNLLLLEDFCTSGCAITDDIWEDILKLKHLRRLTFDAMTSFSVDGLLNFIQRLGPGNKGLEILINNADLDSNLLEDEVAMIGERLAAKMDGRFEFHLMRDPDVSEFELESD